MYIIVFILVIADTTAGLEHNAVPFKIQMQKTFILTESR